MGEPKEIARPERAEQAFLTAIKDLRFQYRELVFWVERDVVAWLQRRLVITLSAEEHVFNDYGMVPGPRRARSADLAVVRDGHVLVAAEFKFEPASSRKDIMANKLPVIGWSGVLKDIDRIQEFVRLGVTPVAWSICIDEGSRYRTRPRPLHSRTEDWDTGYATQVTFTRWPTEVNTAT